VELLIISLAGLLAFFSARDYAGSWNDGSRLATPECLVDYHTLAIDHSIFTNVLPDGRPYGGGNLTVLSRGTLDKIYVDGHFYSDKSPAPAIAMAAVYQVWQWCGGAPAREQPERFCLLMTLVFAGLPYVVAVWCIYCLGEPLGLNLATRVALTASFALTTVALTYTRHVSNHIMLLGVAAAIFLQLAWLGVEARAGVFRMWRVLLLGLLTGISYGIDLGTGPVLLVAIGAAVCWRCLRGGKSEEGEASSLRRRWELVALFALAALPGFALHHTLNYAVGGTLKPANANPEYFAWPDGTCPFTPENMTSAGIKHSPGAFVLYSASMLFGKRGFIGHNLPLFLTLPALILVLRKRVTEFPEVLAAVFWAGGTWMAYALASNNSSGLCCSIRWFVPLLIPAYFLLAVYLKNRPELCADLLVLSGWGGLLAGIMWHHGPWIPHMVPLFWPIQAAALFSWLLWYRWRSIHAIPARNVTPALNRAA
jgi:hypothetical protein